MSENFCFNFYPGDYLRDTQNLSEKSQVAYDRIMCEHMRNICISQKQFNFFTKRLNPDEIEELKLVLSENKKGYFIKWVAASISKKIAYNESRSKNRKGKSKEHMLHISTSHDEHMEYEYVNEKELFLKIKEKIFIDESFKENAMSSHKLNEMDFNEFFNDFFKTKLSTLEFLELLKETDCRRNLLFSFPYYKTRKLNGGSAPKTGKEFSSIPDDL